MPAPLISVIMPAFNSHKYIREAIDSVLNQTEQDFELIIINDGSTDDTEEIVQCYDSDKIRYYANPKNLGIAKTYNRALHLARGEFIAIAEHDDISHPQRLAIQVDYMQRHPQVGVVGAKLQRFVGDPPAFRLIKIKKIKPRHTPEENRSRVAINLGATENPTIMLRADVLAKHHITCDPRFKIGVDVDLQQRLVQVTDLVTLNCVLLLYRRHANNASGDPAKDICENVKLRKHFYKNTFDVDVDEILDDTGQIKNLVNFKIFVESLEKIIKDNIGNPRYDRKKLCSAGASYLHSLLRDLSRRTENQSEIYAVYHQTTLMRHLTVRRKMRFYFKHLFFKFFA